MKEDDVDLERSARGTPRVWRGRSQWRAGGNLSVGKNSGIRNHPARLKKGKAGRTSP